MLVALLGILCLSMAADTLFTCCKDKDECERGIIRPSHDIINHVAEAYALFRPATAGATRALIKKMNSFNLCDEEKQDLLNKIMQNRFRKCATCLDPTGFEKLLDQLDKDIAAINSTCNCKPISQFYIDHFMFNFCATSCLSDCDDDETGGVHLHLNAQGSGQHGRGKGRPKRNLGIRLGLGVKVGGSSEEKSKSVHGSASLELPGSCSSDKFEEDDVLANVLIDTHMQFCTAVDVQFSYCAFPGALSCSRRVDSRKCVNYERDLIVLFQFIDAYVSKAVECLKELEADIDKARDKFALEQVCR